ncbi:MAG: SRPBCC domain-containing protein [Gemmatimonadales bacterium]
MDRKASTRATGMPTTAARDGYRCEITAPVSANNAFDAIGRVSDWWAKNFEGRAQRLDDVFTVRWGETFVTFRITAIVPNAKVVWTVTDCYLGFLQDKTEWTGTEAVWELTEKGNATTIRFAHLGLVPAIECYEACTKGWDQYVTGSLLELLTSGSGQPG